MEIEIRRFKKLTKGKVAQVGIVISLIGYLSYKLAPIFGLSEITANSISSFLLIIIVMIWVFSYLNRVINGKMTFMEQRKRYRKEYEKVMDDKIKKEYDAMSEEDQKKLMEEVEDNN